MKSKKVIRFPGRIQTDYLLEQRSKEVEEIIRQHKEKTEAILRNMESTFVSESDTSLESSCGRSLPENSTTS